MSSMDLDNAFRRLAAAGISNPRLDARVLWEHAGGSLERFDSYLIRRTAREPLAYITGHKEFWSLDLHIGAGVLIPRPESETMIEQALAFCPHRSQALDVLDLGTGSGCLLIAFLREFPNARGLGIELSEEARAFALRNVNLRGLAGRCEIRDGDWAKIGAGPFDVILANPPYIASSDLANLEPEVSQYEPVVALDGGADGLSAYRTLAPRLGAMLKPGGWVFLEMGAGQAASVASLATQGGLEVLRVASDLAGIPRILVARHSPGDDEKSVGNHPAKG
jgi:release factor glutamine methyltransferase